MDTKRLVIVMALSMTLIFAWQWGNMKLAEVRPDWYSRPTPPAASTQPAATGAAPAPPVATTQAIPTTATGGLRAIPGNPSTTILGFHQYDKKHEHANWPVALSINSLGASLERATLNQYKRSARADDPYEFQTPYKPVSEAVGRAFITRTIYVNDQALDLSNLHFRLIEKNDANTRAVYAIDVIPPGSDKPITIQKTFELRQATKHPGLGYEIGMGYSIINATGQPQRVKLAFNGPNVPTLEGLREVPEIIAGFNSDPAQSADVTLMNKTASGFKPNADSTDIDALKETPLLWAGSMSAYFDAIVRPPIVNGKAVNIGDVRARALAAPGDTGEAFVNLYFETTDLTISPDQTLALPLEVYLGPRGRFVLNEGEYFPAFPLQYDKTLVLTGGWCGVCTWTWLINVLVWMLSIFHLALRDWGLAIMALVIVVRLALHPITKKSQVSMARMGKLAPEMERLKEKYKDDKEGMNRAMMQLYKEQGFIPILGCLPILLQMPIWIALWAALQSTFELRQAPFLWGMTWIKDLSQPDRLLAFEPVRLPLLGFIMGPIDGLNILPILLGFVFYVSAKLQPKPPTMTPEQEQQQKMMTIMMPLIFPLMLYSGPSGLNLYILTSTAIGIWESKRVRAHIKEQEEREKAGPVIIDAPAREGGRKAVKATVRGGADKPAGGLAGWLANLQQKAEDVRREAKKKRPQG